MHDRFYPVILVLLAWLAVNDAASINPTIPQIEVLQMNNESTHEATKESSSWQDEDEFAMTRLVLLPPAFDHHGNNRSAARDRMLDLILKEYHNASEVAVERAQSTCGKSSANRIIGGENAQEGQLPWQAFLRLFFANADGSTEPYICGGVVITKTALLTAAHCLETDGRSPSNVIVTVGAIHVGGRSSRGAIVKAISWSAHPGYDDSTTVNDIGIVRVPDLSKYGESFMPACLPRPNTVDEGIEAVASGFGTTSDGGDGQHSTSLKFIRTHTLTFQDCRNRNHYMNNYLKKTMLCIDGSKGTQTICTGDSGGPLVKREGSSYIVIGISSFGAEVECEAPVPSAFTRVKSYLSYICQQTGHCV